MEFIDICIPGQSFGINDLCHDLFYNSTTGPICSLVNTEHCPLGCIDNSSYYANLNIEPIDKNYSGHCAIHYTGLEPCDNLNDARCNGTSIVQTCLADAFGFKKWINTNVCVNNATCQAGTCYEEGKGPVGEFNLNFNNIPLGTKYLIMLVSTILVLIGMVILMSTYGDSTSGLLVGLVLSMITSLTLTIIFHLSLLIAILYIIIGGAIFAVVIRKVFAGGM